MSPLFAVPPAVIIKFLPSVPEGVVFTLNVPFCPFPNAISPPLRVKSVNVGLLPVPNPNVVAAAAAFAASITLTIGTLDAPVPPRAVANVPVDILPAPSVVKLAPLPEKIVALNVPVLGL